MTGRRAFLRTLAAASVGAVLDPERLLWVPGRKTIFVPRGPIVITLPMATADAITITLTGAMRKAIIFPMNGLFSNSEEIARQYRTFTRDGIRQTLAN